MLILMAINVSKERALIKSITKEAIDNNSPIPWDHGPSRDILMKLGFSIPLVTI